MTAYMRAILSGVRPLIDGSIIASEQRTHAHREYREVQRQYEFLEQERELTIALLTHWIDHPATTFDEREEMQSAVASIRSMKGVN